MGHRREEAGGNDDPLRPAINLEEALEEQKDSRILKWVTWLGNMHKEYKECLAYGRYRELLLTNRQYAFARFTEDECLVVAVNNDEQQVSVSIPVPEQNVSYVNLQTKEKYIPENGKIQVTLEAAGSAVFGMIK